MALIPFLPHILYSIAITSISIHLIIRKRSNDAQQARVTAQISVLESIVYQLRSKNPLSQRELDRLKKLAEPPGEEGGVLQAALSNDGIGWRDVFLGRNSSPEDSVWDKTDVETAKKEFQKA